MDYLKPPPQYNKMRHRRQSGLWVGSKVAVGGWTPNSISGIVEYWDFSDTSKITAPSNNVTAVVGQKGVYTLGHGTSPKSGLNTLNGLNVIDFGASGTVNLSVTITSVPQPVSYLVVYQGNVIAPGPVIDTNTGRVLYDSGLNTSANKRVMYAGTTVLTGSTGTTSAEQAILTYNGASSQGWINGISDITGNPGANGTGTLFVIGGDNAGVTSYNGHIAFIGIVAGTIASGDRSSWNAWCGKWGL